MKSHQDNGEECSSDRRTEDYWHCSKGLNIETKKYDENQKDGLLICGINWGGKPNDSSEVRKEPSFFSDDNNKYRYKNRIVNWFKLLGHPLGRVAGLETGFERSLLQTNWIADQSVDTSEMELPDKFYKEWPNFKRRLDILRTKLIIFFSVQMLDALNTEKCACGAKELFGSAKPPCIWSGKPGEELPGTEDKKYKKRYRIGIQYFDKVTVVALPHPSARASNNYISAFESEFSRIIEKYKKERGFKD